MKNSVISYELEEPRAVTKCPIVPNEERVSGMSIRGTKVQNPTASNIDGLVM
jgi:hypothetical protein